MIKKLSNYRILTETQERLFFALGEFQYLTARQLTRLGVSPSESYVRRSVGELLRGRSPLVKKIDFKIHPAKGQRPSLYHLTKKGAELLNQIVHDKEIKFPHHHHVNFSSQYYHRIFSVDFFISLKVWSEDVGYSMDNFSYYFKMKGTNRNNKGGKSLSENRIDVETGGVGYIVPDGVFLVHRGENSPIFGLFEQHNGDDTGRILEQVRNHCTALKFGKPSKQFQVKHEGKYLANRVFISFDHEGCMNATKKRLSNITEFQSFIPFFHFSCNSICKNPFLENKWEYANSETVIF